jgi:hypothetical protein
LTYLTMSWESHFTRSCWTPSDKVILNPTSRASYSVMLLVSLKSKCTMYLIWSPCGVRSTTPALAPCLREEPTKKRVQWGLVKTGALAHYHLGPLGGLLMVSSQQWSRPTPVF